MTEPTPINAKWHDHKVYKCRLCKFSSLDKAKFEDHFAKAHPPLRVIDGGKQDVPDVPAETEQKEGE